MFSQLHEIFGNNLNLIHNTHNGGYGQGNNVGIRQSSAPIIMIMNPDVRLCEPLFKTALEAFERDERLCMYGMKQWLSNEVKSPLSFDCSRRINGYLIPILASIANRTDFYLSSIMYLQGSCFFINKEKFMQAGLFDEDIFMYGEEDDIHWRLRRRFGSHFKYNQHLRYLHLTMERPMALETEKKMITSIAISNEKKGVSKVTTYRNFIRFYRVRLLSAYLKKILGKDYAQTHINILQSVIQNLKKQIKISSS